MQSESSSTPSSSLYVRQSSGLVREASVVDAIIFNAVFSAPVGATLAFGIFYALGSFPGADIVQALLIAFVVNIPVVIMMSMMASAMPRTGGDYVWISRILHPSVAVFSNFAAAVSALIGAAFWARSFAVLALGPALAVLGAVTQNSALINAGNAVSGSDATGQWWTFGLGLLLIVILAIAMSAGTKTSFRVQNVCWIIATVGTFLAFIALLISSNQSFIANFNAFAQPFTHSANSFQAIQDAAAKTGFVFLGGHQFSSTLPVVAIIMTFMMWNWWSVYIAGELKSAGNLRRQLSIMIGALVWDSLFMIIGVLLLYHSATEQFIASINALAGTPGYLLPVAPFYNLMASIAANNSVFALLIAVSFIFWNLPAPQQTFRCERAYTCSDPGDYCCFDHRSRHPGMVGALQLLLYAALYGGTGRSHYHPLCECVSNCVPFPPPRSIQEFARKHENCRYPSSANRCGTLYCGDDRTGIPGTFLSAVWHCHSTVRSAARLHFHGSVDCDWPGDFLRSALRASQAGHQPGFDLQRTAARVKGEPHSSWR